MTLVEIAPDERLDGGSAWLLIRRYRRRQGYDYYVTASSILESRLPRPLPVGGLGFASYEAAHLFSQGVAAAQAVDTLYVTFSPPEHTGHWPALALPTVHPCEADNIDEAEPGDEDGAPPAGDWFDGLLDRCSGEPAVPTAVAYPCDAASLGAAMEAAKRGLIAPLLVGPPEKIRATAEAAGLDLHGVQIIPEPDSRAAAAQAVALVRAGQARLLMAGAPADQLLEAVSDSALGLGGNRVIRPIHVVDAPVAPRPLLVTHAGLNNSPSLDDLRDTVQNAADLAHALGVRSPKVAVLSAGELVVAKQPWSVEAAALCKMAERGQIDGALVDGPLALDAAISPQAAQERSLRSPVAGRADILVTPDLVSGDLLVRQLTLGAGRPTASLALGARVPIVLTARAGMSSLASCAAGVLMAGKEVQT